MVWNVHWITERRSVTIIIIYSPHVLKTITEKPSYYLPQNGQDAKANINSLLIHRIQGNSHRTRLRLLALIIWWPHISFLFWRTVLKKEPSNKSVVDGKMDWVNSGWKIHQQISRKQNRINKHNNNFACVSRFFVHFFALVARLRRETV